MSRLLLEAKKEGIDILTLYLYFEFLEVLCPTNCGLEAGSASDCFALLATVRDGMWSSTFMNLALILF